MKWSQTFISLIPLCQAFPLYPIRISLLIFFYESHFRGLRAIGNGCKKLKSLTLSDCYLLSDKGLEAIASGCKELTHLEVNGCHNIGTMGVESVGKSCQYVSFPA
jgi:F-box/leucine-rich repeat protein 2/20